MRFLDCGCAILENGTRVFCSTCENPPLPPVCRWTQDEDGTWFSSCGDAHVFTNGTPRDNKYAFCPYCGQSLKQVDEIMDSTNAGGKQ